MKMQIETKRLKIFLLTTEQLKSYLQKDASLEKELHLKPSERSIDKPLEEVIENSIIPELEKNPEYAEYKSIWLITHKIKQVIVGSFCFKGKPTNIDEANEVEIGYGTEDQFQNKSYMTKAIAGLIQWTKSQNSVSAIQAETDKNNIASHKVLINNGFSQTEIIDGMLWWKLELPLSIIKE